MNIYIFLFSLYFCNLYKYIQQISVRVDMPEGTNTHATAEELLDMSFSVESMLYQRKVWGSFFPELLDLKYFNLELGRCGPLFSGKYDLKSDSCGHLKYTVSWNETSMAILKVLYLIMTFTLKLRKALKYRSRNSRYTDRLPAAALTCSVIYFCLLKHYAAET
jgi:hypothetical protein